MKNKLNKKPSVNPDVMLERIRSILGLTIEQFCIEMNWPNSKYYNFIKHGKKNYLGDKQKSSPTINKIFDGINFGLANYNHWFEKKTEIAQIINENLIIVN